MNCRHFDRLLSDYLDAELSFDERRQLEDHAAGCGSCSEKLVDAEFAKNFLQRVPQIEPPPELIADIIHGTIGVGGAVPALAGTGSGRGFGLFGFLRPVLHPLLQPRFAMSMAMTVLSFSMLTFLSQGALEKWGPVKANPIAMVETVEQQLERVWARGVQLYETLRMFYILQLNTSGSEEGASSPRPLEQPSEVQPGSAAEEPESGAVPEP